MGVNRRIIIFLIFVAIFLYTAANFVYFAFVSHLTATYYKDMNEELRQELIEQINELLYFKGDSCDLYEQFDQLLLEYGYDGDPQELLFKLM